MPNFSAWKNNLYADHCMQAPYRTRVEVFEEAMMEWKIDQSISAKNVAQ